MGMASCTSPTTRGTGSRRSKSTVHGLPISMASNPAASSRVPIWLYHSSGRYTPVPGGGPAA